MESTPPPGAGPPAAAAPAESPPDGTAEAAVAGVLAGLGLPSMHRAATLAGHPVPHPVPHGALLSPGAGSPGVRRAVSAGSGESRRRAQPQRPTQWTITDESALAGAAAAAADAPPVPPARMNKPRTYVFHPLTPSSMSQMLHYDGGQRTPQGRHGRSGSLSLQPPANPGRAPQPVFVQQQGAPILLPPGAVPAVPAVAGVQVLAAPVEPRSATPPDARMRDGSPQPGPPPPMHFIPAYQLPPGVPVMPGMLPVLIPPGQAPPILVPHPPPQGGGSPSSESAGSSDLRRQGSAGHGNPTVHGPAIVVPAGEPDAGPQTPPAAPAPPPVPRRYSFVNVTSAVTAKLATEHGHDVGIHYKQKRKTISPAQLKELNAAFRRSDRPGGTEREELARRLGMSTREVQVWFQNRRAKQRSMHQKKEIRPPQPLPVPGEGEADADDGEPYPTPFGSPRARRARTLSLGNRSHRSESLDLDDREMEDDEQGSGEGSSGIGSPTTAGTEGPDSVMSPPPTPPMVGMLQDAPPMAVSRGRSGVDLLAMVALQHSGPAEAGPSPVPAAAEPRTLMTRWATGASDSSDLTRKSSTNSSGSVTVSTVDTRRLSVGSANHLTDALEDIRLTEQLAEEDDDGMKGLKRSWSARAAPSEAARDPAETQERDSSPARSNPIKRASSHRHPLSHEY
ncbi:hypothetical protein DFJ74DRAFT_674657 [Hyaloraphidium curvatum]|nr:hypothetical protein DFJ74DRAFT_674657 [Hyaloraphidium curvatum]